MNISDGLIDNWAEEAIADLGEKGWRDIDPNSMLLIIYAVQKAREKKLVGKITKPIWWLLTTVAVAVLLLIITRLFT